MTKSKPDVDVCCRIDEELRGRASEVLSANGLSINDAFVLFLRQVVANQRLPFTARIPTDKTARAMLEAQVIRQQFDLADEMLK